MEPHVLEAIKQMLAEVLRDTDSSPRVTDDSHIVNDLGLDSIQMIAFLLEVEAQLGVQIDFESLDISQLGSVKEFARFIEGLRASRATA
jgi:acyl carrier protein